MKILITGAAGYIGSVLTPNLLAKGHQVTVIDAFPELGVSLADCCQFQTFRPIRGDARDKDLLKTEVPRHDVIIPLAAVVGAPRCDRDKFGTYSTNFEAVQSLLAFVGPDQHVIYPTTNSGYGVGAADAFCTEDSPLKPLSLYGRTKVDAERLVLDSGCGTTLRLATVFGMSPRMRIDLLVNDFTLRAFKDRALVIFEGHFRRNYIHIRDVAGAFVHVLEHSELMRGQAYNVGLSSANLTKIELCARIKMQLPNFTYLESPIGEDPDKRDYIVSNDKIEATGWLPSWSLDAGIAELIRGYAMLNPMNFSNV